MILPPLPEEFPEVLNGGPRGKRERALVYSGPQEIDGMAKGPIVKRVFSKLMPGVIGTRHIDTHYGPERVRVHIPLQTNENCFFCTDEGRIHMEIGNSYLVDPLVYHWVENLGDTPRIHYIFDYLETVSCETFN